MTVRYSTCWECDRPGVYIGEPACAACGGEGELGEHGFLAPLRWPAECSNCSVGIWDDRTLCLDCEHAA